MLNVTALSGLVLTGEAINVTLPPSETGIHFVHDNAPSAWRYPPESMGPEVAIFDYDRDGCMNLFFTNSGPSNFFQQGQEVW